jgi:hypothetical protein
MEICEIIYKMCLKNIHKLFYWIPLSVQLIHTLMFVVDVVEMTNNMHWLYHSFTLYTGSYMFRQ